MTVDCWTDAVGQLFKVGDTVAVAATRPDIEIVVGVVTAIKDVDSKGRPVKADRFNPVTCTWKRVDSVVVTVLPTGSSRFWNPNSVPRPTHFRFPENIVKLPAGSTASFQPTLTPGDTK